MDSKYIEFFNILPKHALLPLLQLVPSKFQEIDTCLLSYVFVQHGVIKKVVSDNLKECASKIIKQQLKTISDVKKSVEVADMNLSEECMLLLDNFLYFKNRYSETISSETITSYVSYIMVTDSRLKCYKFFDDCLYVKEREFVKQVLLNDLQSLIKNGISSKLENYGKYLTTPLMYNRYDCFGREEEIQKCVNVLSRYSKSNVLLSGNTGVGKTSVVYGICNYLQSDRCPNNLKNCNVFELNCNKLVSGTTYRGDLEKRLDELISELEIYNNTILFIDEIHSILNSSGSDESSPIQNVLKPYLCNSSKIIGCTTDSEYKTVERDKAFERRFSVVQIKELSEDQTIATLLSKKESYEKYHNVVVPDNIVNYIVKQCGVYIKNRYFPDKAFDILDNSCVLCLSNGEEVVDESHVDRSVFQFCNLSNNTNTVLSNIDNIRKEICKSVIGQDEAVYKVCRHIRKYYIGLNDTSKPIGSFLFVGPTGTGKTELCKQISKNFFSDESFIRYDMSEFMEPHSVSKIIGSPPGYVGFKSGGSLTEKVKHSPFSIILFDEIEKAHPDVINILLQIMDDGRLTDSFGTSVNFCNCIIVMTSNLGCRESIETKKLGFVDSDKNIERIESAVNGFFSPEFRNRLDEIIYFNKITYDLYEKIFNKELNTIINRYSDIGINLDISNDKISSMKDICYSEKDGVRFIQRKLSNLIENEVLDKVCSGEKEICI